MNNTTCINDTFPEATMWLRITFIIFLLVIYLVGVPGNIISLIIYVKKSPKSACDWLILTMSITDTVVCFCTPSFQIRSELRIHTQWSASHLCNLEVWFQFTAMIASCILLVVIAVDRYVKICHPDKLSLTPPMARNVGLICIIISAIICIYPFMQNNESIRCYLTGIRPPQEIRTYSLFVLCGFIICFFIVTFTYVNICKKISDKNKLRQRLKGDNQLNSFTDNKQTSVRKTSYSLCRNIFCVWCHDTLLEMSNVCKNIDETGCDIHQSNKFDSYTEKNEEKCKSSEKEDNFTHRSPPVSKSGRFQSRGIPKSNTGYFKETGKISIAGNQSKITDHTSMIDPFERSVHGKFKFDEDLVRAYSDTAREGQILVATSLVEMEEFIQRYSKLRHNCFLRFHNEGSITGHIKISESCCMGYENNDSNVNPREINGNCCMKLDIEDPNTNKLQINGSCKLTDNADLNASPIEINGNCCMKLDNEDTTIDSVQINGNCCTCQDNEGSRISFVEINGNTLMRKENGNDENTRNLNIFTDILNKKSCEQLQMKCPVDVACFSQTGAMDIDLLVWPIATTDCLHNLILNKDYFAGINNKNIDTIHVSKSSKDFLDSGIVLFRQKLLKNLRKQSMFMQDYTSHYFHKRSLKRSNSVCASCKGNNCLSRRAREAMWWLPGKTVDNNCYSQINTSFSCPELFMSQLYKSRALWRGPRNLKMSKKLTEKIDRFIDKDTHVLARSERAPRHKCLKYVTSNVDANITARVFNLILLSTKLSTSCLQKSQTEESDINIFNFATQSTSKHLTIDHFGEKCQQNTCVSTVTYRDEVFSGNPSFLRSVRSESSLQRVPQILNTILGSARSESILQGIPQILNAELTRKVHEEMGPNRSCSQSMLNSFQGENYSSSDLCRNLSSSSSRINVSYGHLSPRTSQQRNDFNVRKKSSIDNNQSLVDIRECSLGNSQSLVDIREFSIGNSQSLVDIRECSLGNSESLVDIRECSIGNSQSLVDIRECSIGNSQSLVDIRECSNSKKDFLALPSFFPRNAKKNKRLIAPDNYIKKQEVASQLEKSQQIESDKLQKSQQIESDSYFEKRDTSYEDASTELTSFSGCGGQDKREIRKCQTSRCIFRKSFGRKKMATRERQMTLMLVSITAVFLVSWILSWIMFLLWFYGSTTASTRIIFQHFSKISLINCAASPLIYYNFNSSFRSKVKDLLAPFLKCFSCRSHS